MRKTAGLIAVGLIAFAVTACTSRNVPAGTRSASVPASASASAWPQPAYSTTPVIAEPATTSLHDVTRTQAVAAYRTLVGYVRADSYNPARMRPKTYSASDFASVTGHLTPAMAKWWKSTVAGALKYDRQAADDMKIIAFYNIQGTGNSAFAAQGPLVVDEKITKPMITGINAKHLTIKIRYDANLRMLDWVDVGKPILFPVSKTVTYDLGQTHGTWLIDGVDGSWHKG